MAVYYCGGNQKQDLQRLNGLKNLASEFFIKNLGQTVKKISCPLNKAPIATSNSLSKKPSKIL